MKKTRVITGLSLGMSLLVLQLPVNADWWDTGKELLGEVISSEPANATDTATSAASALSGLSVEDISAGLKDALKVGTENVVSQLGKPEGFNLDENIHIPLPAEIEKAKKLLDSVGMGSMLGDLETKLNRGAEAATPKAKELFLSAISEMSIEDAKKIYYKLSGGKLYGRIDIVRLPDDKDLGDLRGQIPEDAFVTLEK